VVGSSAPAVDLSPRPEQRSVLAVNRVFARPRGFRDRAQRPFTVFNRRVAVKAKINADLNALKADVGRAKHKLDVKVAEARAKDLEWEAGFAIDYAIASIEQAGFAVLDAIEARAAAEQVKAA
jgi:hypothetical protein